MANSITGLTGDGDPPPPARTEGAVVWLALSLILGVASGVLVLPTLFRASNNDLSRLEFIYEAMQEGDTPEVVVLGNSVVMNGVDAALLADAVPSRPAAWNLSSPGQVPLESMLIADQLAPTTEVVVLGVSVSELTNRVSEIDSRKYSAYHAYGYRPSGSTVAAAEEVGAAATAALFRTADWELQLASRWIARAYVDATARDLLRSDLDLKRAREDLVYPSPYLEPVSEEVLAKLLAENMPNRVELTGAWSEGNGSLLSLLATSLQSRGIDLTVLVLPEHPAVSSSTDESFYEVFDQSAVDFATAAGVDVVNARSLLGADMFIDNIHPDSTGAEVLSRVVGERIADLKTSAP